MSENTTLPFPSDALLEHRAWVRSLARSLVRDDHAADDLAQDTMVRALESMPADTRSPRAWLGTVLRNRHRDRLRTTSRRAAREETVGARATPAAPPSEIAAQAEIHRRVLDAVLRLDAPFRDVVLLRFFEGLAPIEIGERLDIPAATARTRLHRALGKLRGELDEAHGGDDRRWRAALVPLLSPGDAASHSSRASRSWPAWMAATAGALVLLGTALFAGGFLSQDTPTTARTTATAPAGGDTTTESESSPAPRRTRERVEPPSANAGSSTGAAPSAAPDKRAGDSMTATAAEQSRVLRVRVLDTDGAPAAGAAVELRDGDGWSKTGFSRRIAAATAGDDGVAEFANPPRGEIRLISRRGATAAVHPVLELGETLSTSPVEMRLAIASPLEGTVIGPDGTPVSGARLTLMLTGDHFGPAGATTTDDTGAFSFAALPHAVFASPANVAVTSPAFIQCDHKVDQGAVRAPQMIRLRRAIVVRGRVVDDDEQPIAEVDITSPDAPSYAMTDADGRFVLGGIDPGERSIGQEPEPVFVRFESPDHAWRRVDLTTETMASGELGDVVLVPGRPIRGVVAMPDGTPVPGAHVYVEGRHVQQVVANLTCDDEGRFEYLHAGEGTFLLGASAPDPDGFGGASGELDDVRAGDDVTVTVSFAMTVLVEFVDADTGEPVRLTNCLVYLEPIDFEAGQPGGGFSTEDGIESVRVRADVAGPYKLTVRDFEGWEDTIIERVEVLADRAVRVKAPMRRSE